MHRALPAAFSVVVLSGLVACSDEGDDQSAPVASTPSASDPSPATAATPNSSPSDGLPVDAMRASVEEAMGEMLVPGAVVLVRSPEGEWLEAFGTRTFAGTEPVTTDDKFRIGSVTKTMTGTVILQLAQEGRLSIDDPVGKYWPDVPNGDSITIAQLLGMRSGLTSYSRLEAFNTTMDDEPRKVWTPDELVSVGLSVPVQFPPGDGYDYSNTNTILAGLIAEDLTGKSIEALLDERIFTPLDLRSTTMPPITEAAISEPHPDGYMFGTNVSTIESGALSDDEQAAARAGTLQPNDYTDVNPSWAGAAGAAISTAEDSGTYIEALVAGGLLDAASQQQRLDSVRPIDPTASSSVGYGLALASFGPLFGHTGSVPGFQTFMGHDPERELTVVVLSNLTFAPDGREPSNVLAQQLIGILYPQPELIDDATDGAKD